jgi:hypothetical protein
MPVIAFISQSDYRVLPSESAAPRGSVVFKNREQFMANLTTSQMDTMRAKLLGAKVQSSADRKEAADRFWHVLELGQRVLSPNPVNLSAHSVHVTNKLGSRKFMNSGRIELLQYAYVPGKDRLIDIFYKKLPPQAQAILRILKEDGREIWTNEEASNLVAENKDGYIVTDCQTPMSVFRYYRPRLCDRKLLKKISFSEFCSKPELRGISEQA